MNLDKALQILGLTRNFTKEELKKAYRTLIAKYHPDRYETKNEREKKEAEEKSKEINVAKEYLENYLKGNVKQNTTQQGSKTYQNINLITRKQQLKTIINNMKEELATIPNILFNELLKETSDKIMYNIKTIELQIELAYTLSDLRILENRYYRKLKELLEEYSKKYCEKYNITLGDKILNKYSLKRLNEELEQLKREQNAFSVEEILDKELNKYVYYAGYLVIKQLIENIKKDIIFKNSIVRESREKIENEFNKRVLKEFKAYYKRLEVLKEYKSIKITNSRIKKLILALEMYIADPEMFAIYEKQLTNAIADTLIKETVEEPVIYNYNNKNINKIKKEDYIKEYEKYINKDKKIYKIIK